MRRVLFQSTHEFLWGRRIAEIYRRELEAAVDEVGVPIRKAGQNEAAMGA